MEDTKTKNKVSVTYTDGEKEILMPNYIIEFFIGESVYLKTDVDQKERYITGINLKPFNTVMYIVSINGGDTWNYGFEISSERDITKVTSS